MASDPINAALPPELYDWKDGLPNLFNYAPRKSHEVRIGNCPLGGDHPLRIQSMTTTPTADAAASAAQCRTIIEAGADYVRLTAQGTREAEALREIKEALRREGFSTPLVADIHFNPNVADVAAEIVEKVRINPGNYVDPARKFKHLEYTDEAYAEELKSGHTGLFLIDLEKGSRQQLLSLQQIAAFEPQEGMDNDTMHFVTHTEFSHSDRYVAFLHRWYKGTYRRTRLLIYDRETGQLHASPTTGMVSHYAWNGQDGLVAYCRVEDVDSHVFFTDATMREWKRCGYPRLNSDGHHHFVNDHCFVVDTYPDRRRHARLYLVDTETDAVEMVADVESGKHFVSPDEHHNWKCDLHPRCSHNGHWLCFDSVHTGKRALCLMEV